MYESVLSCCLFATKTLNSSFADVLNMDLELLLDLLNVNAKCNDTDNKKEKKGVTYKVLD
jgi:hypothetical protein